MVSRGGGVPKAAPGAEKSALFPLSPPQPPLTPPFPRIRSIKLGGDYGETAILRTQTSLVCNGFFRPRRRLWGSSYETPLASWLLASVAPTPARTFPPQNNTLPPQKSSIHPKRTATKQSKMQTLLNLTSFRGGAFSFLSPFCSFRVLFCSFQRGRGFPLGGDGNYSHARCEQGVVSHIVANYPPSTIIF